MTRILAVFELGLIPEHLRATYPDYAAMIVNWLRPALPEVEYQALRIVRGEPIPSAEQFDGYLFSGSCYGVYDALPWIKPLQSFVRDAAGLRRPQFGICFGHQLIASALEGSAKLHEDGWNCGVQTYQLDLDGDAGLTPVYVMHQDQVKEKSKTTRIVGHSEECAIGALSYAAPILTVQFHPEFSAEYMTELLRPGVLGSIPAHIANAALESLKTNVDSSAVAEWAARFFRLNFTKN